MPRYSDKHVTVTLGEPFATRAAAYVAQHGLGSLETALVLGLVSLVDGKEKEPDRTLMHRQHVAVTNRLKNIESAIAGIDHELYELRKMIEHLARPPALVDETLLTDPDWLPVVQETTTCRVSVELPRDLYGELLRYASSPDWRSTDEVISAALAILMDWRGRDASLLGEAQDTSDLQDPRTSP